MPATDPTTVTLEELAALRRRALALDLSAPGSVTAPRPGAWLTRHRGHGIEFEDVREYQHGDDYRSIDWRVTARSGKPHTKRFREEKERNAYLVLDRGESMRFASRKAFKWVVAARAAALLAWALQSHGDRVGGLIFGETRCLLRHPRGGEAGVMDLLGAMAAPARPGAAGLDVALGLLRRHAPPGSLLFLLSDFQALEAGGEEHIAHLARHHDLLPIHVHDPLEAEPPARGRYPVLSAGRRFTLDCGDEGQRRAFRQPFADAGARLQRLARRHRLHSLRLSTADPVTETLRKGLQRPSGRP